LPNPTKYAPQYSFSGFQAQSPDRPLPAMQLDNELQNIANTAGETIDALATIRRSDGQLVNEIVTVDSLSRPVRALIAGVSDPGSDGIFPITDVIGLQSALDTLNASLLATTASIGQPNGIARLDVTGKLALTHRWAPTFAELTGKPTTLAGYGISDAYTKLQTNAQIDAAVAAGGGGSGGGSDTPSQVLEKLKTVDGSSSGLDADLLDGLEGAAFLKTADRGQANGVATLGADSKIPVIQLPKIVKDFYASDYPFTDAQTPAQQQVVVDQMVADVKAAGGGRIVIDRLIRTTVGFRIFAMSDVLIEGSGKGAIVLTTDSTEPAVRIEQKSTRVTVRGVRIDGPSNWTRPNAKFGIYGYDATHVRIEDCHISLCLAGVWLNRVSHAWVENCFIKDLYADGIHFALGCTWCVAKGNHVEGQTDDCLACTSDKADAEAIGIPYIRTSHILFIGNTTSGARDPLWGSGIVAYESDHVTISDNDVFSAACNGICISSHDDTSQMCRYITVADNRIYAPGQAQKVLDQPTVSTTYSQGSGMFLNDAQYVLIVNNRIDQVTQNPDTTKAGIFLQHVGQMEISGNRIRQVSGYGITGNGGITDVSILDNIIEDTNREAIDFKMLGANLTGYFDVSGNRTRRINGAYALNIGNPSTLNVLVVADNVDALLKTSNVDYRAALSVPLLKDNTPPIWYPMTVSWSSGTGTLAVTTTSARFCIEGGSYVVNVVGNVTSNNGGGLNLKTPFGASGMSVAFLNGWMSANNVPFIGRHQPNNPGGYTFITANGNASTAGPPTGTGEFRIAGQIPIN